MYILIQFKCENGRVVLPLKFHEWNQSEISAKFSDISTAKDFELKWLEEMSGSGGIGTSGSSPSSHPIRHNSNEAKSPKRAAKRKHYESSSQSSLQSTSILIDSPSPSKRCKFIKESIDESIERSRKGSYFLMR